MSASERERKREKESRVESGRVDNCAAGWASAEGVVMVEQLAGESLGWSVARSGPAAMREGLGSWRAGQ